VDRLERLVNLVAALLDAERPLSRQEVRTRVGGYADETGAFRRNFERDKDLLRQMGMPLLLEPLDPLRPDGPVGYRIPRDRYELPDPGLEDDELAALRLAASAVDVEGAWGRSAATSALWKLAAATRNTATRDTSARETPAAPYQDDRATPRGGPIALELPAGEGVAVLFGAVTRRQRVRFAYRDEVREVDPWRLSYRNGQWYLAGFDHARRDRRTFRLDRLLDTPVPVGEPGAFERPEAGSAAPPPAWQIGEDDELVARLLVDADQADWAVSAVGEGAVVSRRQDGSVVLDVAVSNRGALRTFVLGFLDHAEILGPEDLRDEMIRWLERLAGAGAVR
jgi:proteasome accessory factor B